MPELPVKICPVCGAPVYDGVHSDCNNKHDKEAKDINDGEQLLIERFNIGVVVLEVFSVYEYVANGIKNQHIKIEDLSENERLYLQKKAYENVDVVKFKYLLPMFTFLFLQDYVGLKKIYDDYTAAGNKGHDLVKMILELEDYEDLVCELNENIGVDDLASSGNAFNEIEKLLLEQRIRFLEEHNQEEVTGTINDRGIDLVAIRNLSRYHDVSVPIARGGLIQGAIADFWGMETKMLNIEAHNREIATGEWVGDVDRTDFEGKDVLLFDKDAVSGATIKKAVEMLEPFNPKSISVYFTYNVQKNRYSIGTIIDNLPSNVKVYTPNTAPRDNAGDIWVEANEKLETLIGKRFTLDKESQELIIELNEKMPMLSEAFKKWVESLLNIFDNLNHHLQGIDKVRSGLLNKLGIMMKQIKENTSIDLEGGQLERIEHVTIKIIEMTEPLIKGYEDDLVRARYAEREKECVEKRGLKNIHVPSSPLEAFDAAKRAVEQGYEIALIVGPEGFAYEPYFLDLGIQTVAINIPESGEGENRSLEIFDDMSALVGKKVIVVEDDVRTGATLEKVKEAIGDNIPSKISLYLGQEERFQLIDNIPGMYSEIFIARAKDDKDSDAGARFQEHLKSKGLKVFKNSV